MSGLISAAAERLRAALSLVTGAGMIGYSTGQAYTAGSLGAGLRAEETARGALALSVGGDVAAVSNAVANLADEVDANATAASDAVAVVQGNIDTISLALAALIKPGFVIHHAGALAADPAGWFICDGRQLNTADHPALFAAIGYLWGGAAGVFNLPATVHDFVRGAGAGRAVGTRELDAFQGHYHNAFVTGNITMVGDPAIEDGPRSGSFGSAVTEPVTDGVNGVPRTSNETRPRNVAMYFLIKR